MDVDKTMSKARALLQSLSKAREEKAMPPNVLESVDALRKFKASK